MVGSSIKAVNGRRAKAPAQVSPRTLAQRVWRAALLWRRSLALPGRLVMTLALAFAVVSGASAPCLAADLSSDGAPFVHGVRFELSQDSTAQSPEPSDTKGKASPFGLCSAHCAAHVFSLWTPISLSFAPTMKRLAWAPSAPQGAEVSRPSGLERPPRV
jgi:hypothetical protein